ncbi:uncharacterized protein [Dermacentor albipictus]|uniref:uncharacterized protein isoform X2 n=1 Tax=Dermacentor albipictus TaxID=60249 RepID=UPI0038FC1B75
MMEMACPLGYGRKGTSCELCPASTYGRGVCLPCPTNTYSLKAGSAYCQPCPPGAYVGTQCHPADNALQLSLVALVMKYGFITASSLSLILVFALLWLKTRRNARSKAVPTSLLTSLLSDEFLSSRVPSYSSCELPPETSSSESDCDVICAGAGDARRPSRTVTTRTTTKKTSSSSTRTACARVGVDDYKGGEDEKGASSDDSGVVGDGAGGDASPNKRLLILKRLKEHGAVLPVKGVDILRTPYSRGDWLLCCLTGTLRDEFVSLRHDPASDRADDCVDMAPVV